VSPLPPEVPLLVELLPPSEVLPLTEVLLPLPEVVVPEVLALVELPPSEVLPPPSEVPVPVGAGLEVDAVLTLGPPDEPPSEPDLPDPSRLPDEPPPLER
jgi:hypothetical protein